MEGRREDFSFLQTFGSFAIGPVNSRRLIPVIQARPAWNVPTWSSTSVATAHLPVRITAIR
jgi:hypothetical protein